MRPKPPQLLAKARVRVLLVTDLVNVRYLSGAQVSSGAVLVTPQRYLLFTDARYAEEVRDQVRTGVKICDTATLPNALKKLRRCGFESENVTISTLALWKKKFKSTKFVQVEGVFQEFRRTKDTDELTNMRKANALTKLILAKIPTLLKPGIREREVAWKLEEWARAMGAEGFAFPAIVGFGKHTSHMHHHPGAQKLRKGDLVQIDMGVLFHGYCSDFSQVYFTKPPTSEQRKVFAALLRCKKLAKRALKAGVSTHALDRLARTALERDGVESDFPHALGHGVGLEIHEGVVISTKRPDAKVLSGEVLTIEPGVYRPGQWGMRLEETIIVA